MKAKNSVRKTFSAAALEMAGDDDLSAVAVSLRGGRKGCSDSRYIYHEFSSRRSHE